MQPFCLLYVAMACSSTSAYPFVAYFCSTQKEVESELAHHLSLLAH